MQYDVFISYSRTDYLDENNNIIMGSPVDIIVKSLDNNKIKYWIDIDGDNASNQYMSKIAKAISNSKMILFVSSKNSNSNNSYWPIKEILLASEKQKEIVPIRIDNCEFHDNIALALAGLDILEYYKNSKKAIEKLLKLIVKGKIDENIIPEPSRDIWHKIRCVLGLLFSGVVICFLFFATFGTIGFCVGFFSNIEDEKVILDEAFRNGQIEVVKNHTIEYRGDKLCFKYDIETGFTDFVKNESKLFEQITFEHIMMSASIPLAFERLFKTTQYGGNGKSKIVFLVCGSIGILCGYTIGEDIGLNCALIKNEEAIKEYLIKDSTIKMLKEKMKYINY